MFGLLKNRNFFCLWMGQTISLVGDGIRNWAMVYWVFKASGSPVTQSLSFIAVVLPTLLLGPFAGVLVDRWDRRKVMIVSDIVRGVLSLALIYAAHTGSLWIGMGITFLGSCVAQFFDPARMVMIPRVVGQEHLLQANSLSQTTHSLLSLASPALGVAVFTLAGPRAAFALDALTFFLSALFIALVAVSGAVAAKDAAERSFGGELKEGLRYGLGSSTLRALTLALTALMLGGGAINALGIFIIRNGLGLPEEAMVYANTAQPLVSMLAAATLGTAARKIKQVPLLVPAGIGLAALGVAVIGGAPALWVLVCGAGIVGLANVLLGIGLSTTFQTVCPDEMRGRVHSMLTIFPTAAMVLSAAVAGFLAQNINPRLVVLGAAAIMALATFVAYGGLRGVTLPRPAAPTPQTDTVAG